MDGLQVYAVVYIAVKKHIKTHVPPKGFERFWDFARMIPHYGEVTSEQADALTTSVSHSTKSGLEAFYQIKVNRDIIARLVMKNIINMDEPMAYKLKNFFYDENGNHRENIVLGDFTRTFFDGRRVLNENDEVILASIIHKDRSINHD